MQKSRVPALPDPLKPIAGELVGKTGSIAVRVVDVFDNNRQIVFPAPPEAAANRGVAPYLVLAECENPTATYLSPDAQRRIRHARDVFGRADAGARVREQAERGKPAHQVWILSDVDAVANWARGSRQYLHAEVVSASLGKTFPHDYVRVPVVVRMQPTPAAATQPAQMP